MGIVQPINIGLPHKDGKAQQGGRIAGHPGAQGLIEEWPRHGYLALLEPAAVGAGLLMMGVTVIKQRIKHPRIHQQLMHLLTALYVDGANR